MESVKEKMMEELPECYGLDDCTSRQMSFCTFVGTCGKSVNGQRMTEAQAMKEAVTYWRAKADEYLAEINRLDCIILQSVKNTIAQQEKAEE